LKVVMEFSESLSVYSKLRSREVVVDVQLIKILVLQLVCDYYGFGKMVVGQNEFRKSTVGNECCFIMAVIWSVNETELIPRSRYLKFRCAFSRTRSQCGYDIQTALIRLRIILIFLLF